MTKKEALKRALKELIQARINLDHGQKNGVPAEQMAALREKVEYRETVVEALRPMPHGDPLTLEQLRGMDGKPVWIMESPDWGHWEFSEDAEDYILDRDPDLYGLTYPDPEGKAGLHKLGWIAYAYPPVHIDREAWEPCYFCKTEQCFNCRHDDLSLTDEPCNSCVGDKWEPQYKFCPKCGRPFMTEAWAMLEKRLRW